MDVKEKVDEKGSPMIEVTTDKTKSTFTVFKGNNGFVFYEIKVSNGSVPKALQGNYTRMEHGLKAVQDYIRGMKVTSAKKRDKTWEDNHAATAGTETKEHIREGASD